MRLVFERGFEPAGVSVERNGAAIYAALHDFHSGSSTRREERENLIPAVRRAKAKVKHVLVFEIGPGPVSEPANLRRRSLVGPSNRIVEAPNASEPGGQCDLIHRHAGLVD